MVFVIFRIFFALFKGVFVKKLQLLKKTFNFGEDDKMMIFRDIPGATNFKSVFV